MSDRRVSIGLAVVALALAIATVFDLAGDGPAPAATTRVIPEMASSAPSRIAIMRDGSEIVLEDEGDRWRLREPVDGPADPAAMRALLGAAEMLSYQRREIGKGGDPALGLASPRARLALRFAGGATVELAIGGEAGAGAGVWLSRGAKGDAFLVPPHAAAELVPALANLRGKRLVGPELPAAIEVVAGEQRGRLSLDPPAIGIAGGAARADPATSASLWRGLRGLDIERFVDQPSRPGPRYEIPVVRGGEAATELVVDGGCDGDTLHVVADIGAGCVPAAPVEALAAIATAPESLVDRSVIAGGDVEAISFGAGAARVERVIGEAERDSVRRWRAALEAAVTTELRPSPAKAEPIATVAITTAGAPPQKLRLYRSAGGLLLRRDDEPVALVAEPGARALLEPSAASRLRDLSLIEAEPSRVQEIRWHRGDEELARWRRGDLLEDWRDEHGGALEAATYEPVLEAVAPLRAERGAARLAPGTPTIVSVAVAPAARAGDVVWHRFEIVGCTAREVGADAAFVLDDETCAALAPPPG